MMSDLGKLISEHRGLAGALSGAGWTPGRAVDIADWSADLTRMGYEVSIAAEAVLRSLGGLVVDCDWPGRQADAPRVTLDLTDPVDAGDGYEDRLEPLELKLGQTFCPIGLWVGQSSVFVGSAGAVIAHAPSKVWGVGEDIVTGLVKILLGEGEFLFVEGR
jgi:hypothetical protein